LWTDDVRYCSSMIYVEDNDVVVILNRCTYATGISISTTTPPTIHRISRSCSLCGIVDYAFALFSLIVLTR